MRRLTISILTMFFALCVAYTAVPGSFEFQGRLRENGAHFSGNKLMSFKLYTLQAGGSSVWSSSPFDVVVENGVFSVSLSPVVDWRSGDYWIETIIEGNTYSPRQKITPQIYSLHSKSAEELTVLSGDLNLKIADTVHASINTTGLNVTGNISASGDAIVSGNLSASEIVFPDNSTMSTANIGSADSVNNNNDVIISADADYSCQDYLALFC